jgi:hypothetical protein
LFKIGGEENSSYESVDGSLRPNLARMDCVVAVSSSTKPLLFSKFDSNSWVFFGRASVNRNQRHVFSGPTQRSQLDLNLQ